MRLFALAFTSLVLASCAQSSATRSGPSTATRPADAPPLQFQVKRHPGGEPFDIASERGNVVLLDVWATWCEPCRESLPFYDNLARRYADRGLKVYALSVDENARSIPGFLEDTKISLPVLLDPDSSVSEQLLGVRSVPTTILLDRQGRVRYFHEGFKEDSVAKYQAEVAELLAEPAP